MDPTTLYIDNASAIALAQECSGHHHKVRHFLARLRYLIEQVENKVVRLVHLEGTEHPSDVLTKPKPRPHHEKNVSELMGPQTDGAIERSSVVESALLDTP